MTNVKIDIDNQAVTAAFNRLLQLGQNPGPVLQDIGGELHKNIQQGFEAGVSPYGQKWAPLKHRSGKPLLDNGHLQKSISYRVVGNTVEIGTNLLYARLHQFGGVIRPKNKTRLFFMLGERKVFARQVTVPARPFMPTDGLPDGWRDDVVEVVMDVIRRQVE